VARPGGFGRKNNPDAIPTKNDIKIICPQITQVLDWRLRDKCNQCKAIMEPRTQENKQEDGTLLTVKFCSRCDAPMDGDEGAV